MGEWMYRSTFFLTSALAGGVVSFTFLALYPRGKSPRYPLDRRLSGSQSRSGRLEEEKIRDTELSKLCQLLNSGYDTEIVPERLMAS
jgi:hypothetical protein